jgi:hypothetical protein
MTEREYWRVKMAQYRESNRDHHNATKRAWHARNAERINATRRERRAG